MVQTIEWHSNVASNEDQIRVYQNCKFHDPRAGIFVLGRGHESHRVKMHDFLLYIESVFRD